MKTLLSIRTGRSQALELPRHPKQKPADGIAMPAIWWNDMGAPLTVSDTFRMQ